MNITSGFVQSGKFSLRYTIEGSGIPIVIIGSSIYYPRTFSSEFKENYTCIFIDHRGFTASPGHVDLKEFNLDVLVNDIELVCKAIGIDSFFVLGHSGHGYLALEYAKKFSKRVRGVILIAVGPDQSNASAKAADEYFEQIASAERKKDLKVQMGMLGADIESDPENRMIHYLLRSRARGWYDYHFDARSLWKDVSVNMEMFDHVWGNVFKSIDITKDLDSFNIPVLLILGKYDSIISPPAAWEKYIPLFKDITVEIFNKSGHTPQFEESDLFDQQVEEWIKVVEKYD